ncbi:sugar ABC transporter permease [Paenibacillus sp. KQZ6P-2]|uniref:Sugar ABC transporter permease n=1 Tax=Paenibacillus mangrovi TaxID=2931978 RepID=A0A9X1WQ42_9BACL|nr:sugar ABC transporter permease [Paenibacillus mangrovi]MCJ8012636.1 sugar ABC transporter permease [Paenibacillus mangrovi]
MAGKRILSARTSRKLEGTLFMAPWLIGFIAFLGFPLLFSLYMSFHQVKILPKRIVYDFVGLKYYQEILFNSSALYDQLIPYFQEVVIMVPVIVIFALMIAIMLNQKLPGRFVFRAIFFLPVIFSTGAVLMSFMNQGEGNLSFLERYNVGGYIDMFLGDNSWAKPVKQVMNHFVLVLWYSGVQILLFIAGLQTISSSAYESARIDGATPWEVFWKITLPAMSPFILLNLIYTVVDMFTFPSNPVITLISTGNYGYNSAMAWIYFLIILAFLGFVILLYGRINRKYAKSDRG